MLKKVFSISFDECTLKSVDKKDGVYSIIFYVYYMIAIFLYGMLLYKTEVYRSYSAYFIDKALYRLLFYIPDAIVNILPIFLILLLRRQSIVTVGIKGENIGKSILQGVLGSIPFSIMNILGQIISGKSLNLNISVWIWSFLYFLICIAFVEELVFRGFLQTRIFGLVKNKWAGILIVGVMFSLMHVPFQMLRANMSIIDFIIYDARHLITTFIMHIYFAYLYTRTNSLIAPTIAHAIMNFSYEIFI